MYIVKARAKGPKGNLSVPNVTFHNHPTVDELREVVEGAKEAYVGVYRTRTQAVDTQIVRK